MGRLACEPTQSRVHDVLRRWACRILAVARSLGFNFHRLGSARKPAGPRFAKGATNGSRQVGGLPRLKWLSDLLALPFLPTSPGFTRGHSPSLRPLRNVCEK